MSKSTQAVCLSGDFLFQHLVEMICLLSPVDLLLSSSAAHYCSHKAARSGERQAGRREGREGGKEGREGGRVVLSSPDSPTVELYPAEMYDTVTRHTRGRAVINRRVGVRVNIHHRLYRLHSYRDDHFSASLLYGCRRSGETRRMSVRAMTRDRGLKGIVRLRGKIEDWIRACLCAALKPAGVCKIFN